MGNLRTAWISERWARVLGEPWVVRFDDIDRPRILAGAEEKQLHDLQSLGLKVDCIYKQSQRMERHLALFSRARDEGSIYPCFCSRKEVQESLQRIASAPHGKVALYDGKCRDLRSPPKTASHPSLAWRFRSSQDAQGARDFIVARTNSTGDLGTFQPGYAWATAIDDLDGDYALLVRAYDLAPALKDQREIQAWVQTCEGRTAAHFPAVFHTALVNANDGSRLEKRSQGVRLQELRERGISPEALLHRFEKSFAFHSQDFAPAKIWGESHETLRLRDLDL